MEIYFLFDLVEYYFSLIESPCIFINRVIFFGKEQYFVQFFSYNKGYNSYQNTSTINQTSFF